MILKKFTRANFQKTKAAMIGGLVDYVLAHKDEEGNRKRLYCFGINFLPGITEAWKREMIALAEESTRSRMPVSHWAMSWQENEMPDYEQVLEAVNIFLERMGLKEHQTLVAAHVNTGNFHIHIVVNRTHPYTEKVIQPHRGFDIEAAHRIVAEIEHKQGWASQEHARYRINEKGEIVRNRLPKQVKPCPRVEDFENATGEKSAQRIAREKGHAVIQNASCWEELHAGLNAVGLRFVRKGSGAVISWETRQSRRPAWTGISACPNSANDLESSNPAFILNGLSASPPRSRSAMYAVRSGRSIRRSGKDWWKRIVTPERNGRKSGTNWKSGRKSAVKWLPSVLLHTGFPY